MKLALPKNEQCLDRAIEHRRSPMKLARPKNEQCLDRAREHA